MKTFIFSLIVAAIPSMAFATNCHNQAVVQSVVTYAQPVITHVQPVRAVQFVEVPAYQTAQVKVIQQDVQYVPTANIVVQKQVVQNHHGRANVEVRVEKVVQRPARQGFFARVFGR